MSEEKTKQVNELMTSVVSGHMPDLTEEEWAERDALAATEEERWQKQQRAEAWGLKKEQLLQRGLSLRHLEFCYRGGDSRRKLDRTKPAIAAVMQLRELEGLSILSGGVGSGKTQASHYWLLDALHGIGSSDWSPSRVRYATAAWFARASRYGTDKFDVLAKPDRLVLDDLGVEFNDANGSLLVDIDELIDTRWASKKATLLLTNLPQKQFIERYKKRAFDRARDTGRWFDVTCASMRGGPIALAGGK